MYNKQLSLYCSKYLSCQHQMQASTYSSQRTTLTTNMATENCNTQPSQTIHRSLYCWTSVQVLIPVLVFWFESCLSPNTLFTDHQTKACFLFLIVCSMYRICLQASIKHNCTSTCICTYYLITLWSHETGSEHHSTASWESSSSS